MATFATDANCLVASLSRAHAHHARAIAAINSRLSAGDTMIVAAHSLAETYSVLTRVPPPTRLFPPDALYAIERSVLPVATIVALSADGYADLIRRAVRDGTIGGQIYDAIVVTCARAGGADEILTFNERHFRPFEGDGLTIVVP